MRSALDDVGVTCHPVCRADARSRSVADVADGPWAMKQVRHTHRAGPTRPRRRYLSTTLSRTDGFAADQSRYAAGGNDALPAGVFAAPGRSLRQPVVALHDDSRKHRAAPVAVRPANGKLPRHRLTGLARPQLPGGAAGRSRRLCPMVRRAAPRRHPRRRDAAATGRGRRGDHAHQRDRHRGETVLPVGHDSVDRFLFLPERSLAFAIIAMTTIDRSVSLKKTRTRLVEATLNGRSSSAIQA